MEVFIYIKIWHWRYKNNLLIIVHRIVGVDLGSVYPLWTVVSSTSKNSNLAYGCLIHDETKILYNYVNRFIFLFGFLFSIFLFLLSCLSSFLFMSYSSICWWVILFRLTLLNSFILEFTGRLRSFIIRLKSKHWYRYPSIPTCILLVNTFYFIFITKNLNSFGIITDVCIVFVMDVSESTWFHMLRILLSIKGWPQSIIIGVVDVIISIFLFQSRLFNIV